MWKKTGKPKSVIGLFKNNSYFANLQHHTYSKNGHFNMRCPFFL